MAKETIELLEFLFDLGDATQASLADDGKISIGDAPKFFGVVWKAPVAIGGIQNVPKELSDLSEEGKAEVLAYVRQRFDLPDDELELLIEDTLQLGFSLAGNVSRWLKYSRKAA